MPSNVVTLRMDDELLARVDAAAGGKRGPWIKGLIEQALSGDVVNPVSKPVARIQAAAGQVNAGRVKKHPKPETVEQRFLSAGRRMASELKDQDKAALLALVRERVVSSRDAEKLLSLPGLRYRNAEKELMAAGTLWVTDGVMETFDE